MIFLLLRYYFLLIDLAILLYQEYTVWPCILQNYEHPNLETNNNQQS